METVMLGFIFLFLSLIVNTSFASNLFYLCGSDEDGCNGPDYLGCLCMPYDSDLANQPYCLDFDNVSCVPLSKMKNCNHYDVFKNQATCLAVAFQSEPMPPCPLTTANFCEQHHIPACDKDGGEATC
jgi:hypothetical protein